MRFTIRDLLWLLLVVAILCGWYVQQERRAVGLIERYQEEFDKVADVMLYQDLWRQQNATMRRFIESQGTKVTVDKNGAISFGPSKPVTPSTHAPIVP
jgi:DNA-binding transcriptional regulator/RsmH inhibitor MraZ